MPPLIFNFTYNSTNSVNILYFYLFTPMQVTDKRCSNKIATLDFFRLYKKIREYSRIIEFPMVGLGGLEPQTSSMSTSPGHSGESDRDRYSLILLNSCPMVKIGNDLKRLEGD